MGTAEFRFPDPDFCIQCDYTAFFTYLSSAIKQMHFNRLRKRKSFSIEKKRSTRCYWLGYSMPSIHTKLIIEIRLTIGIQDKDFSGSRLRGFLILEKIQSYNMFIVHILDLIALKLLVSLTIIPNWIFVCLRKTKYQIDSV